MTKNKVALFGDLTALFQIRSVIRSNIDYRLLDKALKKAFNVEEFAITKFYTLFKPDNEGQVKFVSGLKKNFGWDIETKRPSEIRRIVDKADHKDELNAISHRQYRFDSQIAYDIGEVTAEEDINTLVVVSDSLELMNPLLSCTKWVPNVNLAFFGDALDQRWWKILNKTESKINFMDLTRLMHQVSQETKVVKSEPELSRFE